MSQITMTDGKRTLTFPEREGVRRRILEQQGWRMVGVVEAPPQGNPPQGEQDEGEPDGDLEVAMLEGARALAPEAVDAALERAKTRDKKAKNQLPTL